jgi:NTE family protein
MASNRKNTPRIDLALQGGGSHGAFTWGVLDRLLEDGTLTIDGISGTSAGALNAGVLATGWQRGGAAGARDALRDFWLDVSSRGECFGSHVPASPSAGLAGYNLESNPFFALFNQWLKLFSPYQFNPLGLDPLRDVAARHIDTAAIAAGPIRVFVIATSVTTGQAEVFSDGRLSLDAFMASACLPQLFKAVEIDGEPYWDGGYSGNPALWPLIYGTDASDILLVKINPLVRPGVPDTVAEITDRVNEITFNAGLAGEMRAIHFVQELLGQQKLDRKRYKDLRLHMVSDEAGLAPLHPSSKMNTSRNFLLTLHGMGRVAAERWLERDRPQVGRASTLDIEGTFLAKRKPAGRAIRR